MNDKELSDLLICLLEQVNMGCIRIEGIQGLFFETQNTEEMAAQYLYVQEITEEITAPGLWLKEQAILYDKLKKESKLNPEFLKNVSCLLCIQKTDDPVVQEEIEKFVLIVENDSYYFKKYALVYESDEEAITQLTKNINGHGFRRYIDDIIQDVESFSDYIEDRNSKEYALLVQLLIKLPFIKLNFKFGDENINLIEMIDNAMSDKALNPKNTAITVEISDEEISQLEKTLDEDWEKGLADVDIFFDKLEDMGEKK